MTEATTIHVLQAFIEVDGYACAEEPIQCVSAAAARAKAHALKDKKAGVIAWSRSSIDPSLGDWSDPIVLARYGAIPDEFMETGGVE